jgi:hypothetical protein
MFSSFIYANNSDSKFVVFYLLKISELVLKLGAIMHYINNVVIVLIPEQEDSSCP